MSERGEDAHLVDVVLRSVPVSLRERSTEHGEELLREMTYVAAQAAAHEGPTLPARLVQLADEVAETFGIFTVDANAVLDMAARRGDDVVDELVYSVPSSVADFCERLLTVIDEVDAYCRQGEHLLTLATPPDVLAYQHWIVGEFVRQPRGEAPLSWPEYRERFPYDA
jgi:hypothetical protein